LEVNSQQDKANLITDSINRIKTIFEEANIDMDFLYNLIYFIMQISHSPIMTTIDIDMLRDRFESRYIKTETNKILRNAKLDQKAYFSEFKFVIMF